ncbi:unnamed protein product [Thelazia callipaeda]|uniref:DUF148 domain-containing protein n=1 Tax=Thelazia callipaeda TaxID=103827 RepID=A0A0N5D1V3_THECL|nr:unnamed protein product [Thelazia callipaeda]
MMKINILFMIFAAATYGDLISDSTDFFSKKFTDVKSLFANDENQLKENVGRVKDLLSSIQGKESMLKTLANDGQKSTLEKVGNMVAQISNFQKNILGGSSDFSEKKKNWEQIVKDIFVTQGLNKILPLLQKLQNNAPAKSAVSVLLTCTIPLTTIALWR